MEYDTNSNSIENMQNAINEQFRNNTATVTESSNCYVVDIDEGNSQNTKKYKIFPNGEIVLWDIRSTLDKSKIKYKDVLTKIVFEKEMHKLTTYDESWDISVENNGNSIAYLVGTELYIQTDGIIAFPTDSSFLFGSSLNLESIEGLEYVDTSNVIRMDAMFYGDVKLKAINLTNWDTPKLKVIYYMFYKCESLTNLDLNNFNVSKVSQFASVFNTCINLKTIAIDKWDTSNATSTYAMFCSCNSLEHVDVHNFNTSKVTDMGSMFVRCTNLKSLDLSNWDTSQVTDMSYMFDICESIKELDISSFDTYRVTNMKAMFSACSQLINIYVKEYDENTKTGWTTINVENSGEMFNYSTKLAGGNGTIYDKNQIDKTYARIDKAGEPGYFTKK